MLIPYSNGESPLLEFNPNHEPAGSSKGGQFTQGKAPLSPVPAEGPALEELIRRNGVDYAISHGWNSPTHRERVTAAHDEQAEAVITAALGPISKAERDAYLAGVQYPEDVPKRASPEGTVAAQFLAEWTTTSAGTPEARRVQELAAKVFELEGADVPLSGMPESKRPVFDRLTATMLTATYTATQEYLKAQGIEYLTLYRGVRWTTPHDLRGVIDVDLHPLSSFTTDYDYGKFFAASSGINAPEGAAYGTLIAVRVPRGRVFSLPMTGFGSLVEREVVLLGGSYKVHAISVADPPPRVNGHSDAYQLYPKTAQHFLRQVKRGR